MVGYLQFPLKKAWERIPSKLLFFQNLSVMFDVWKKDYLIFHH